LEIAKDLLTELDLIIDAADNGKKALEKVNTNSIRNE
jgi:hypothetical protein